jgi:transcriptional regulator with XRE-family HTH domain
MASVSENIRIILNELDMSQTDFAEEIGVSTNYINMIVTGRRRSVSRHLARLIETLYGYSMYWILNGKGEKMANEVRYIGICNLKPLVEDLSGEEINQVYQFIEYRKKRNFKKQPNIEKVDNHRQRQWLERRLL